MSAVGEATIVPGTYAEFDKDSHADVGELGCVLEHGEISGQDRQSPAEATNSVRVDEARHQPFPTGELNEVLINPAVKSKPLLELRWCDVRLKPDNRAACIDSDERVDVDIDSLQGQRD